MYVGWVLVITHSVYRSNPTSCYTRYVCGVCVCVCVCVCVTVDSSSQLIIVCVEWVLHTTHGVYGFPTSGCTAGIAKLDKVLSLCV